MIDYYAAIATLFFSDNHISDAAARSWAQVFLAHSACCTN